MGRIQNYSLINCAVNPQCSRERDFAYNPVLKKKKVLIDGGGVAGMECARVLAIRGHEPVLYERAPALGGALRDAGAPSFKEDDLALIRWYEHTLEQLQVEVHLNTELTAQELRRMSYDTLVLATGAKAKVFPLGDGVDVLDARTALHTPEAIGERVVIIGGMVGCELALWLRRDCGKQVTIVEALQKLLAVNAPLCSANKEMLERLIPFHGVAVRTNATAVKAVEHGVLIRNLDSGEEQTLEADTVILAVGFRSDTALYDQMQDAAELYAVGDCRQFKNVHQAIWDSFEVANHI